jgi:hypothetical protein
LAIRVEGEGEGGDDLALEKVVAPWGNHGWCIVRVLGWCNPEGSPQERSGEFLRFRGLGYGVMGRGYASLSVIGLRVSSGVVCGTCGWWWWNAGCVGSPGWAAWIPDGGAGCGAWRA